jgi:hypothetical protein
MRFYQSPLFIIGIFAVAYGIYLMTNWGSGPMGWGYLAGAVIFPIGLLTCFIHFILKVSIKNKRYHLLTEIGLLSLFFIWLLLNS